MQGQPTNLEDSSPICHICSPLLYISTYIRVEKCDPVRVNEGHQNSVSSKTTAPPKDELDPDANLEDGISTVEKDSTTPLLFPLATGSCRVRKCDSVPVVTLRSSAHQG